MSFFFFMMWPVKYTSEVCVEDSETKEAPGVFAPTRQELRIIFHNTHLFDCIGDIIYNERLCLIKMSCNCSLVADRKGSRRMESMWKWTDSFKMTVFKGNIKANKGKGKKMKEAQNRLSVHTFNCFAFSRVLTALFTHELLWIFSLQLYSSDFNG